MSGVLDSLLAHPSADAARDLATAASRGDEGAVADAFGQLGVELELYLGDLAAIANSAG